MDTPNYVGEGVAYNKIKGILHIIFNFFACGGPPDATSNYDVTYEHPWHHL